MPSRSKKHQAERLRRKKLWQDVEAADALLVNPDYPDFPFIDGNKLDAFYARGKQ